MTAEIEISHVSQTGQGVGYDAEGHIYFVPGAIPGDTVEVSFSDNRKRYRDAELVSLKKPSPDRVTPVCSHFGECGGCDWLQWDYQAQLKAKEQMLDHLLDRNDMHFRDKGPIIEAPSPLGYRNRIQLHCKDGKIGFHRRRSHDIVAIEYCHIAHPKINEALRDLRRRSGEAVPDGRIELLLDDDGVTKILEHKEAESFVQVNPAQNERLRGVVAELVQTASGKNILELYCGNGNLTFAYRPSEGRIVAVDASPAAIAKARKRDEESGTRTEFLQLRIDKTLVRKLPADFKNGYDTLILDPPRGGSDLKSFVHKNLKHIMYVSCSPSTFLRDVQSIKTNYSFEVIQPLDMFPHSRHIEFVAYLKRL